MKKYINIDDRTYSQLEEYCRTNKINLQEYLSDSVRNQLYIDIYGDMNQLRGNKPLKEDIVEEKKENNIDVWDNIDEIIINKETKEIIIFDKEDKKHKYELSLLKVIEEVKKEEVIDNNVIEDKPIRIKRQIQTK